MKRPVELVEEVIRLSQFPFDDIFLDSIPSEEIEAINKTQILLTESENTPSDYGNSQFISVDYGVYIQIFYSNDPNLTIDITKSELELMQHLIENNWLVLRSTAHYPDPDTGQMIKNLTVQRTINLSELEKH